MISVYRDGKLCETASLRQAVSRGMVRDKRRPVISAVGAGGKTTTLRRLSDAYIREGVPVIVTTTTHILWEERPYFLSGYSGEDIREILKTYGQVWVGQPAPGGKLGRLPDRELERLLELAGRLPFRDEERAEGIPVLVEADGAKGFPLKVPAGHEPVLLPCTTQVLSVYGLDAIGKKIEDTVFRPELAERILNRKRTERVTAEDIARLAASGEAGRKGCPANAGYTVVLNKADDEAGRAAALSICRMLRQADVRNIIVTGGGQRSL